MSHKHKGDEKVNVAVRCRPMFASERRLRKAVECSNKSREVNVITGFSTTGLSQAQITKTFTLDKVFGPNSTQLDVYESVVSPQLHDVLNGYNCTVLAYGQTGTGKTFTMEGERTPGQDFTWDTDPKAGLIPRAMSHLFDFLENSGCEFSVRVSLLEIYNEEIYDLLSTSHELLKMNIYNDNSRKGSVVVANLTEIHVRHKSEVYDILQQGAIKRRTAATDMNEFSSRSHSVFSVTVHYKEVAQNEMEEEELVKIGKLNLVDLAGSENIGRSGAVDKRAREAGNINQSLLTLGRCITALVDHSRHIPYRESKLTRLLQDSLGGTTKTSIIATISPGIDNVEETLSTLEYACRAKNIHNRPIVNQKLTKRILIKQYDDEIEKLRREVVCLREKNGVHISEEEHERLTKGSEELQALLHQREVDIAELKSLFDINVSELAETKSKLDGAMEDLQVTNSQLAETQILKEAHIIRGSRLKSQATELIKVADTVSGDVSKLHDKVARQEETNHHNLHATKASVQSVQSSVGQLHSHTLNIVEEDSKELKNNLTILEASMERQQNSTNIISGGIQHWQTDITNFMKNNLDLYEQLKTKMESNTAVHKEVIDEWKNDLSVIVAQTVDKLDTFNKDVASLNNVVEYLKETTSQHQTLLRKQIKTSEKFEEKVGEEMTQFANTVCGNAGQQEEKFNAMEDKLKSVMEMMEGLRTLSTNTVDSTKKVTNNTHTMTSQYVSEQQSQNNGLIDDLNNDKEKVGGDISGIISTRGETLNGVMRGLNEINTTSNHRGDSLHEVCTDMQEQSGLFTSKAARNTETIEGSDHAIKLKETVTAESKAHEEDVTMLVTAVTNVMDNNNALTTELEERSSEINSELERLVGEELKPAASLGVTPCRKRYNYERNIPRTPGDQSILQDHHQREQERATEEELPSLEHDDSSEENESGESSVSIEPDLNQSLTIPDTRGQPFFFKRKKKKVEKTINKNHTGSRLPLRQQNH